MNVSTQVVASLPPRRNWRNILSRIFIYGALLGWTFIALFPIYWTVTTSFKTAVDVTQGHLIPFIDFMPDWKGWRSLGLSPDRIFQTSTARDEQRGGCDRRGSAAVAHRP